MSSHGSSQPLSSDIQTNLLHQLKLNRDQIIRKYAHFASCLCTCVKDAGIGVEDFRTFLLKLPAFTPDLYDRQESLLSAVKQKLKEADTINKIFDLIGEEYTSFLNYDVFQCIRDKYCKESDNDDLKYSEHFKAYVERHNIKEFFAVNPSLQKCSDADMELQFKIEIKLISKMTTLVSLKSSIASILNVPPAALRIKGIDEGCVILTFLIPGCVKDILFVPGTKLTSQKREALRALSVLWVRCGDFYLELAKPQTQQVATKGMKCYICLNSYTDLKLLQCLHVYCYQCLESLVAQDQQEKCSLTCPTCRQITPIPSTGVAGLPSAICTSDLEIIHCPQHPEKESKLHCEQCEERVCHHCILEGGKHYNHVYRVSSTFKKEILSWMEPLKKNVETLKKSFTQTGTSCEVISHQVDATETDIRAAFKQLRKALDAREDALIGQLHQITRHKLKCADQMGQLENKLAQLTSSFDAIRETFRTGSEVMAKKARELTTLFQQDTTNPSTDIIFTVSPEVTAMCQNYGKVGLASKLPDPSKFYAISELEAATVGKRSMVSIQAVNFEGKEHEGPIKFECELISEKTGTRTNHYYSVEKGVQPGRYKITYQPIIKGRHQLHIKVDGQHIRESPFSVAVKTASIEIRKPVEGPFGAAIAQKGELVVTGWDDGGGYISVFSPTGDTHKFRTESDPYGVITDEDDNILVAHDDCIRKFTIRGKLLSTVGSKGSEPLQFDGLADIAFNNSNNMIYTVDSNNHRVQVLHSDLTFFSMFGERGSEEGQFTYPHAIACDATGKVYVADSGNHRIQVFTSKGDFVRAFGKYGQERGELGCPNGIAVGDDMVYVSEANNRRISVFTSEGESVFTGKEADFEWPVGVVVDNNGMVYVCDHLANSIKKFTAINL